MRWISLGTQKGSEKLWKEKKISRCVPGLCNHHRQLRNLVMDFSSSIKSRFFHNHDFHYDLGFCFHGWLHKSSLVIYAVHIRDLMEHEHVSFTNSKRASVGSCEIPMGKCRHQSKLCIHVQFTCCQLEWLESYKCDGDFCFGFNDFMVFLIQTWHINLVKIQPKSSTSTTLLSHHHKNPQLS